MIEQEVCGDDRFEIIGRAKEDLLKKTNIESDKEQMNVVDSFLFRCWQMGWLEKYRDLEARKPCNERYPEVLRAAEITMGNKLTDDRCFNNTSIRTFVAYRLREEGYTYREIGAMMGRDHSSITHLAKKMRDMLSLPNVYKVEVVLYQKFINGLTYGKE